jgi:hybrid cluster-associated redox disulfide protein
MSRQRAQIDFDMTVNEVMRRWPATIRVFLDFRLGCVGCPIAGFHTVADACREHCVEPDAFLAALWEAASAARLPGSVAGLRVLGDSEQPVRVA